MTPRPATRQRRTSPARARKPIRLASILVLLVAVASLQWPATPVAGQAASELPAVQQAATPSESNAPSADTDRWRLDDVWVRVTDCYSANIVRDEHGAFGQKTLTVSSDCEEQNLGFKAQVQGTMTMVYPDLMQGGERAKFTVKTEGKMQWEVTGSNEWAEASLQTEMGSLYRCSHIQTPKERGGVTGSASLSVEELACTYDPAVDFRGKDEVQINYRFFPAVTAKLGEAHAGGIVFLTYKRCTNPDDCPTITTITGKVYVPAPPSSSSTMQGQSPTRTSTGRLPLIDVPVTLTRNGVVLDRTVTLAPDGRFLLSVPSNDNLTLGVNLMHGHHDDPIYRVRYGGREGPIARVLRTLPTVSADTTWDIEFSDKGDVTTYDAINPEHLDDLGVIYYHTHQAWELADSLGQELDFPQPLDIIAFSNLKDETYWSGPRTGLANPPQPYINIAAAYRQSLITAGDRPDNREWHEFGHQVMADAFDNLLPSNTRFAELNHGGYHNPSTTDSWVEGFAHFYSMMVARDIDGDLAADRYRMGGQPRPMEPNDLAWTDAGIDNNEELAVAGLLWDLVDPVDRRDATTLGGTTYADCVEVSFDNRLWDLLTTDWGDTVPRSDAAPAGYGYIFDIKHLYDVLKKEGIGDSHSCGGELTDLDELFIAHGFFADTGNPKIYDRGEQIGRAASEQQPDRRNQPAPEGSYLAFEAVDDQTGAPMSVQDFSVEVRFPPPYEHFSYSFRTNTAQTPDRLLFLAPDAQFQTTTYVTAEGPGYVSKKPLVVTNAFYYEQMASEPSDHFMEHTFEMERREGSLYLPLVARQLTDTPSPTPSPPPDDVSGIFGQVTKDGKPAAGLDLDLEHWDGTKWTTAQSTTTGPDGRYLFSPVAGLSPGQAYAVRYSNTYSSPNPGPGYLYSWSGEQITQYQTGTALPGGDFDVADIVLNAPADGATVTLPAQFCWQPRSISSDNYVLYMYYPAGDAVAKSEYLGRESCFTIFGLPGGWPTGAEYQWWVRAYQGQDPDSTPYNYGDSYSDRVLTILYSATSQDSRPGFALQLAPRGESDSPPTGR